MKKYAVVYKNRPRYKGVDSYLKPDGTIGRFSDDCVYNDQKTAIDKALEKPVLDNGHLPAQIIECTEKSSQTTYSPGRVI